MMRCLRSSMGKVHIIATEIIFNTRDRVHKIVLYLHEEFAASHRQHRKLAVFFKLGLLMEMLRDPTSQGKFKEHVYGSVFRDLLHMLLQGLAIDSLVGATCELLRLLCQSALEEHLADFEKPS